MLIDRRKNGMALFSRDVPAKLLWRSDEPVFAPEKDWEKVGQVPNIVFVESIAEKDRRYLLY
jgi:predicted GH43/DUF377 family glycosyl hydrolase